MDYTQYEDDFRATDVKPVPNKSSKKKEKEKSPNLLTTPSRRISSREKATIKPLTKHEQAKLDEMEKQMSGNANDVVVKTSNEEMKMIVKQMKNEKNK